MAHKEQSVIFDMRCQVMLRDAEDFDALSRDGLLSIFFISDPMVICKNAGILLRNGFGMWVFFLVGNSAAQFGSFTTDEPVPRLPVVTVVIALSLNLRVE